MDTIQRSEPQRCTAKAKGSGERCKRRPHPGSNVCVKHGANGGRPATKPETILRNTLKNQSLREKGQALVESGFDVLDLNPIAGMLHVLTDELDQDRQNLSENSTASLFACIDLLRKTAETIERVRASKAFTNSERDWFLLALSGFVELLPEAERPRFKAYIDEKLLLRSSATPKALTQSHTFDAEASSTDN